MNPNQKLMVNQDAISYAIGVVSQFIQNPHIDRQNVVIHILKYEKRGPGQGLLYDDKGNTKILGYCDTYWVGCCIDRRFTKNTVYSLEGISTLGIGILGI